MNKEPSAAIRDISSARSTLRKLKRRIKVLRRIQRLVIGDVRTPGCLIDLSIKTGFNPETPLISLTPFYIISAIRGSSESAVDHDAVHQCGTIYLSKTQLHGEICDALQSIMASTPVDASDDQQSNDKDRLQRAKRQDKLTSFLSTSITLLENRMRRIKEGIKQAYSAILDEKCQDDEASDEALFNAMKTDAGKSFAQAFVRLIAYRKDAFTNINTIFPAYFPFNPPQIQKRSEVIGTISGLLQSDIDAITSSSILMHCRNMQDNDVILNWVSCLFEKLRSQVVHNKSNHKDFLGDVVRVHQFVDDAHRLNVLRFRAGSTLERQALKCRHDMMVTRGILGGFDLFFTPSADGQVTGQ